MHPNSNDNVPSDSSGGEQDEGLLSSSKSKASNISELLEEIEASRDDIKGEIQELSRDVAPDVDTWISRAEKLQADIQKSKATAREIVKEAEEAAKLRDAQREATRKLQLLGHEVSFNQRLESILQELKDTAGKIGDGKEALVHNDPRRAFESYKEAEASLAALRTVEDTMAVDLLQQRAAALKREVASQTEQYWSRLLHVDRKASTISINRLEKKTDGAGSAMQLQDVADLMLDLDILDGRISQFGEELDSIVFRPRMTVHDGKVGNITIGEGSLSVSSWKSDQGVGDCIEDLTAVIRCLNKWLPNLIVAKLTEDVMPTIISRLTSKWLPLSIPTSVDQADDFQRILDKATRLSADLVDMSWTGRSGLDEWVEQAPRHWLSKRRESALAAVKMTLATRLRETKTVERVETRVVSDDDVLASSEKPQEDDWNSAWHEQDDSENTPAPETDPDPTPDEDDEDLSAWDVQEEPENGAPARDEETSKDGDEDADAWGWHDDDEQRSPTTPSKPAEATATSNAQTNGDTATQGHSKHEMTLRETLTVTQVPDALYDLIHQIASDADSLRSEPLASSAIADAAPGLLSLPTLVLAGYRALSPTYYMALDGGNMFLYNDTMRLAASLTTLTTGNTNDSPSSISRMKLSTDISSLESFARRAYAKEMDAQRTILRDLLDGAQGFANCTQQPFSGACDAAVSGAADYIRALAARWAPILSRSALLQSLGSLVATVTGKMVLDVEELGDISEPESRRIKDLCDQVAALGELFVVTDANAANAAAVADSDDDAEAANEGDQDAQGERRQMAGVYVAGWFKFQYLAEILESSLADIRYLWQEAELKLEFDADEVVDLVEALFADSDLRRRAVAEIRRG